jgi:hypothetical protein
LYQPINYLLKYQEKYIISSSFKFNMQIISLRQWFPKCGARPPGGAEEIHKGGARGAKLFYSLKINKKHKYNLKNQVLLDGLLSKIRLFMFHI